MVNETPQRWFVELTSAPTADGTSLATVKAEKSAFRAAAKKAGLQYTERYAFDTLWNGLSVNIAAQDVGKLSRIAGVKAIWPVVRVEPAQEAVEAGNPDLYTAIAMTGADVAQNSLGLTVPGSRWRSWTPASTTTIPTSAAASRLAAASRSAMTWSVTPTTPPAPALPSYPCPTTTPTTAPGTAPTWPHQSGPARHPQRGEGRGSGRHFRAPTACSGASAPPTPTS
jgi:hypothetical protein